jgi:hypothetical protein
MPTVCEIKMQLKELGVKGLTGKNKAELYEMLLNARPPLIQPKKRPVMKARPAPEPESKEAPAPARVPMKRPVMKARPAPAPQVDEVKESFIERSKAKIKRFVEEAKAEARKGASMMELKKFYASNISPIIGKLYDEDYLNYKDTHILSGESYEQIENEYIKRDKEEEEKKAPEARRKKTIAEIFAENTRKRFAEAEEKKSKMEEAVREVRQVADEANEASKEGHPFRRRQNWKGKAKYMKKLDALWEKFPFGLDLFMQGIPFEYQLRWEPKKEGEESHEHYMYRTTGRQID